jgi:hypothetical protein
MEILLNRLKLLIASTFMQFIYRNKVGYVSNVSKYQTQLCLLLLICFNEV